MRLQILDSARDDLIEGFYFYEKQELGLGGLLSDEPLLRHGGPEDIVWNSPEGVSRFSPVTFE